MTMWLFGMPLPRTSLSQRDMCTWPWYEAGQVDLVSDGGPWDRKQPGPV